MAMRKAEKVDNIRRKRRVFPARNLDFSRVISKIGSGGIGRAVITGVSAPVFNTRRFRLPFSSYVKKGDDS